jgi:hypothetical protein
MLETTSTIYIDNEASLLPASQGMDEAKAWTSAFEELE